MNNKQNIGIGIAVVVTLCLIGLCVVGGIGLYMYQTNDDIQAVLGTQKPQNIAQLLPANTQFYMSMTPNIQALPGYDNLKAVYLENPEILALIENAETEVTSETDITFQDDISPWLGTEVVFAIPDFSAAMAAQQDSGPPPDFVIAAHTRDPAASEQFVNQLIDEADGEPFTTETYQDVTLHIQPKNDEYEELVVAMFTDLVVMSTDQILLKDMIDKSKGSDAPTLVNNSQYTQMVDELPAESVTFFYMELGNLFNTLVEQAAMPMPTTQMQDMQAFKAIGMAGSLQSDGIQIDVAMTYDVDQMSDQMKAAFNQEPTPNQILNQIPANAIFALTGNNLNLIWQQMKQSLQQTPDFEETMQDMETEMGLNIDEDIFGWMTGEYGLVLIETTPPDDFMPPVGGYVLIGSNDVADAQARVTKVVDIFQEQMGPFMEFEPQTVEGIEVNVLTDPLSGEPSGGYGFHNDFFLLAYPGEAIEALAGASQNPLTGDATFQAVQNRLPSSTTGYFYANVNELQSLMESQMSEFDRQDYEQNVRPFIDPIHALGSANNISNSDNGVSKGSIFFLITQ